ncbi:MAG: hypothetical protein VZQ80_07015 [Lachnospiraceae bacterium]|nr:hypothetical protein [Lachnospiraceae bacterium]
MSASVNVKDDIDFSKAIKNPFAKIARASKDNNGELPPDKSRQMMREAIAELRKAAAEQNEH